MMFTDVTESSGVIWHFLPVVGFQTCQIHEKHSSSQSITGYRWWRRSDPKKFRFACPAEVLPCAVLILDERHENPLAEARFGSSELDTNYHCSND